MRRSLLAAALILATGGWVCDSAGSCPQGELTCSSDVADHICCPQGSPYRCGGTCSATPQCSDFVVCKYPDDPGSGLCTAGAYQASIPAITCTAPTQPDQGTRVTLSGTLIGCGPTAVVVEHDVSVLVSADCGTWHQEGGYSESNTFRCIPGGSAPTATEWHVQGLAVPGTGATFQANVSITLTVGDEPVLAQATLACPPSP